MQTEISLRVTDGKSVAEVKTTLTVLNANGAPIFDELGEWDIVEGQPFQLQVFAFDPDNPGFIPQLRGINGGLSEREGSDPTVTYAVTGLPAGATFDPDTVLLSWVPGATQAGTYNITVTATDSGDGLTPKSTTTTIPIVVRNANRSPVLADIPNQFVDRGTVLDLPVTATDPDGNPLTLTATGLPRFATFVDNHDGTGSFHFAPGADDRGDYVITISATDNGDGEGPTAAVTTARTFVVTARSASEAPHLDWVGDAVAVVGQPLSIPFTAKDLDQDTLTFSATGLPPGATLVPGIIYGTATLNWTPSAIGIYDVTVTVRDNGNGGQGAIQEDTRSFRIVARAANQAPLLAPIGARTLPEAEAFEIASERRRSRWRHADVSRQQSAGRRRSRCPDRRAALDTESVPGR